jgi:hypothetical protein
MRARMPLRGLGRWRGSTVLLWATAFARPSFAQQAAEAGSARSVPTPGSPTQKPKRQGPSSADTPRKPASEAEVTPKGSKAKRSEAQRWFDSKVLLSQASVGALLLPYDPQSRMDFVAPALAVSAGPIVSSFALSAEFAWMGVHLDEDNLGSERCPECDVLNVFALSLNPQFLGLEQGSWVFPVGVSAGLVYTEGWREYDDDVRGRYHPAALHPQVGARIQAWRLLGESRTVESESWRGQQIVARAIRYEELCRDPADVSAATCAAEAELLVRLAKEGYPLACAVDVELADDEILAERQIRDLLTYGRCLESSSDVESKQAAFSLSTGVHLSLDGEEPSVAIPITVGIVF